MKRFVKVWLSIIIFAIGGLNAGSLYAQESSERAPSVTTATLSEGDAQWTILSAVMASVKQVEPTALYKNKAQLNTRDYDLLHATSLRILCDVGFTFFESNPDDLRRWEWLNFVVEHDVRYLPPTYDSKDPTALPTSADIQAAEQWKENLASVSATCLASASAPVDLKCRLRATPIFWATRAAAIEMSLHPGQLDYDWSKAAHDIASIGVDLPEADVEALRNAAALIIRKAKVYAKDKGTAVEAEFKASPNLAIRGVVEGPQMITEAMKVPMDMHFTAIDGRNVDLAAMRGKVVLIDYRGITWCSFCRDEEPLMKELYAKYHAKGFEIICIAWEMSEGSRQFVRDYCKEHGLIWPVYFDGKSKNPYVEKFGFTAVPQYLFLDKNGLVVSQMSGGNGLAKADLEGLIKRYLGLPSS